MDRVPRREPGMTPYEVMLSESQERMLMVVSRGREEEALAIFRKWDLDCAIVGAVTDSGRVRVRSEGRIVADMPVAPLAEGLRYDRPTAPPPTPPPLDEFPPPFDLGQTLLRRSESKRPILGVHSKPPAIFTPNSLSAATRISVMEALSIGFKIASKALDWTGSQTCVEFDS